MTQLYKFIKDNSATFPITVMCSELKVNTSCYCAWNRGETYVLSSLKVEQEKSIEKVFTEHNSCYGAARLVPALVEQGVKVGLYRVRSVMKKIGLRAIQPKSFTPKTTDPTDDRLRKAYLLENKIVSHPNEVLVGDITYLRMQNNKFLYLATWIDMYSRMVVGWHLDDNMRADIVISALNNALGKRNTSKGLIIHTDGGKQYIDKDFKSILTKHKFEQSMTRKDNHYDNAMAESWFSRLKTEKIRGRIFQTKEEANSVIFEYIEQYYNRKRLHSSLGMMSPTVYEEKYELRCKENAKANVNCPCKSPMETAY